MSKWFLIILWIFLNILFSITQDIALFAQTKDFMVHDSLYSKIITNEFIATILWIVAIPLTRMGYKLMGSIQLNMISFLLLYFSQIISNFTWLNEPTTIDDYFAIGVIVFGLVITNFKVFG